MAYQTKNYRNIREIVTGLKNNEFSSYSSVSFLELYQLAIQIQRNEILIAGLGIAQNDSRPSFIENLSCVIRDLKEAIQP